MKLMGLKSGVVGVACAMVVLAASTAQAATIHVDAANCPGPGDGSVGDPYCSIQTAIDNAVDTDEIVVAPGTYFETINFLGKAITLSSSGGAAVTTIDGTGFFHVVQCVSSEGPNTILDGFTITGGNANGSNPDHLGGGMLNNNSSPTVTNCTFSGNSAPSGFGGGMSNISGSSPTVTNCMFSGNDAFLGGGMANVNSSPIVTNCTFTGNTAPVITGGGMGNLNSSPIVTNCTFTGNTSPAGGGMGNISGSSPTVTNCTFSGNSAIAGGGMYNEDVSPTVTNCTFNGNLADNGGGMGNFVSSPIVTNCTFNGNSAVLVGGAMHIRDSDPTVTNCTFALNSAANGQALAFDSFNQQNPSDFTMTNCIVWNSGDGIWNNDGSTITIGYSDVQGGFPGSNNIDADPMFVDPSKGDYRLQPGSPCIDAGNNWGVSSDTADLDADSDVRELTPFDLDGNARFANDPATTDTGCGVPVIVDMGAYEFQGTPVPNARYLGDLNADRVVGIVDFLALLANWGPCGPGCCLADLDIDGTVGITDFLILLGNWG